MSASALIAALLSTDNTARSEAEVSDFFLEKKSLTVNKYLFEVDFIRKDSKLYN